MGRGVAVTRLIIRNRSTHTVHCGNANIILTKSEYLKFALHMYRKTHVLKEFLLDFTF